jgi:hypothetical protein
MRHIHPFGQDLFLSASLTEIQRMTRDRAAQSRITTLINDYFPTVAQSSALIAFDV